MKAWFFVMFAICSYGQAFAQAHTKTNATATASSSFQEASLAVDQNQGSRWESNHDIRPSWFTLDFGAKYDLSEVILYWEAANAVTCLIEDSNDTT